MQLITLNKINKNILVISRGFENFDLISEHIKNNKDNIIIFIGGITIGNNDYIINNINYIKNNKYYYLPNKEDLLFTINNKNNINIINEFIQNQFAAIRVIFNNQSILNVISGGLLENINKFDDLERDFIKITFVKEIDNKPWHEGYNGKIGYIISELPVNKAVKLFNYSSSIGIENSSVIQEFTLNGMGKSVILPIKSYSAET